MAGLRFAVIMLAWGMAARGAEVRDAESAMAARIEFLRDANAKMKGRLEKIRGAISYWAEQGFTADKDEEEGPAASAEPASASGRGRRLESKLPGGVKVWQGGVLHNFQNAQSCEYSMVKVRPWRCPSPARVPGQGAAGGSGQFGTTRMRGGATGTSAATPSGA